MNRFLITGVAGMIGCQLAQHLLNLGFSVIGVDSQPEENNFTWNTVRLEQLKQYEKFQFSVEALKSSDAIQCLLEKYHIDCIFHLAASAGVKFSHDHPAFVLHNNQDCFVNLLEAVRNYNPKTPVLFASSSSVYGGSRNEKMNETMTLEPKSIYALSKIQNEQTARIYANTFGMKLCAFRFFTVYGEYNRKDMFIYKCLEGIEQGTAITLYHQGQMMRDFVYVQDIVKVLGEIPHIISQTSWNFECFNLGGGRPVSIAYVVELLEQYLDKKAHLVLQTTHPDYDPIITYCDNDKINQLLPLTFTPIETGLQNTVKWFKRQRCFGYTE